jgi:hypothetical protein
VPRSVSFRNAWSFDSDADESPEHRTELRIGSANPYAQFNLYPNIGMDVSLVGKYQYANVPSGPQRPDQTWGVPFVDTATHWSDGFPLSEWLVSEFSTRAFDPHLFINELNLQTSLLRQSLHWYDDRPRDFRFRNPTVTDIEVFPRGNAHALVRINQTWPFAKSEERLIALPSRLEDGPAIDLVVAGPDVTVRLQSHVPLSVRMSRSDGSLTELRRQFSDVFDVSEGAELVFGSSNPDCRMTAYWMQPSDVVVLGEMQTLHVNHLDTVNLDRALGGVAVAATMNMPPTEQTNGWAVQSNSSDYRISIADKQSIVERSTPLAWNAVWPAFGFDAKAVALQRSRSSPQGGRQTLHAEPIASTSGLNNSIVVHRGTEGLRAQKARLTLTETVDERTIHEEWLLSKLAPRIPKSATLRVPANAGVSQAAAETGVKAIEYDFLPGIPLAAKYEPDQPLPNEIAARIAHACADMYLAARGYGIDSNIGQPRLLAHDLTRRAKYTDGIQQRDPGFVSFLQRVLSINNPLPYFYQNFVVELTASRPAHIAASLKNEVCHEDLTRANVLDIANKKIGFIDWEFARVAPFAMDLWRQMRLLGLTDEQAKTHLDILQERQVFLAEDRKTIEYFINVCRRYDLLRSLEPDRYRIKVWVANDPSQFDLRAAQLVASARSYFEIPGRKEPPRLEENVHMWLEESVADYVARVNNGDPLTDRERIVSQVDPERDRVANLMQTYAGAVWSAGGSAHLLG